MSKAISTGAKMYTRLQHRRNIMRQEYDRKQARTCGQKRNCGGRACPPRHVEMKKMLSCFIFVLPKRYRQRATTPRSMSFYLAWATRSCYGYYRCRCRYFSILNIGIGVPRALSGVVRPGRFRRAQPCNAVVLKRLSF